MTYKTYDTIDPSSNEFEKDTMFTYSDFPVSPPGLPPFSETKTGQKNIRVPPLIFTKKFLLEFEKQYTYLINLNYI
jgi:hypothetical protein